MKSRLYITSAMVAFSLMSFDMATAADATDVAVANTMQDGAWVSLTGDVVSTDDGRTALAYPGGVIEIELDAPSTDDQVGLVAAGERVTVTGVVDADFGETRTVEADTLLIHSTGALHTSMSYVDDEDAEPASPAAPTAVAVVTQPMPYPATEGTWLTVRGTVMSIDDVHREFVLDLGPQNITVDTGNMETRPLDQDAELHLSVGDSVTVTGSFDDGVFERDEIQAQELVTAAFTAY